MKNIRINVTKNDIKKGSTADPSECPIARACRRAGLKNPKINFHNFHEMDCDSPCGNDAFAFERQKRLTFKMPMKATKFVKSFDRGENVKPFSFTLTT